MQDRHCAKPNCRSGQILRAVALVGLLAAVATPASSLRAMPPSSDDVFILARWCDAEGPQAVIEGLGERHPAAIRLRAVRAVLVMGEPERALAPLLPLVTGRDPDLAEAAARISAAIASTLTQDDLARREADLDGLASVAQAYGTAASEAGLRADLAQLASAVADGLRSTLPSHGRASAIP